MWNKDRWYSVESRQIDKEVITGCFICGTGIVLNPGIVAEIKFRWRYVGQYREGIGSKRIGFICESCLRQGRFKFPGRIRDTVEKKGKGYDEIKKHSWGIIKNGVKCCISWDEYKKWQAGYARAQRKKLEEKEGKKRKKDRRKRGMVAPEDFEDRSDISDLFWAYLIREGFVDEKGVIQTENFRKPTKKEIEKVLAKYRVREEGRS